MKNFFGKLGKVYRTKVRIPTIEEKREAELVSEIRRTRSCLDAAYNRFDHECNEVMLDSVIFEIQSLRARYRFLLQLAREQGIECGEITVFS